MFKFKAAYQKQYSNSEIMKGVSLHSSGGTYKTLDFLEPFENIDDYIVLFTNPSLGDNYQDNRINFKKTDYCQINWQTSNNAPWLISAVFLEKTQDKTEKDKTVKIKIMDGELLVGSDYVDYITIAQDSSDIEIYFKDTIDPSNVFWSVKGGRIDYNNYNYWGVDCKLFNVHTDTNSIFLRFKEADNSAIKSEHISINIMGYINA